MSVKGFSVNGAVEQYDAGSLTNVAAILDTTLTQSGKAADAKAAGDAVDELKSATDLNVYGADWSGSVNGKAVTKKLNEFSFGTTKLGSYRYFSMLSDVLYASTANNVTTISESAFTLQDRLEPYATYTITVAISDDSNVGGNYIGVYDHQGHVLSDDRITGLSAGKEGSITFTNNLTPAALCMQCNGNTQAATANLTITIKKTVPGWINLAKSILAPVLDSMTADTALGVNDFRIVGDTLYRITANVASGGTLTEGTNCAATTIGEEITALLNA